MSKQREAEQVARWPLDSLSLSATEFSESVKAHEQKLIFPSHSLSRKPYDQEERERVGEFDSKEEKS